MYELTSLGFDAFFAEQLPKLPFPAPIPARVAAEHRGAYEVWTSAGSGTAKPAGKLRHEADNADLPGVGDWVVLDAHPTPDRPALIEAVLNRRTVFVRGASGREARAQVVAANVDLVFVVCGLNEDFNLRRIERYLARIWAGGAQPTVILNKADLHPDPDACVLDVESRCPGVPVFAASAVSAQGLTMIRAQVREGRTVALVGSSGVGKSTLVNALLGEEIMATGEIRARDGRGQHVTTHRQLTLLPGGGLLLDTPGMRELQLPDDEGLDEVFADIRELAERCRFRDCRHETEPGCAVKEALDSGELDTDRFENYRKLEREARANELRRDAHARHQADRAFGQMCDEVMRLHRLKRGE